MGGSTTPTAPPADFSITSFPTSVQMQAGGAVTTWNPTVTISDASKDVTITFPNLPSGVQVLPSAPITASSGESLRLLVYATTSATVGSATVTVQGSLGSVTHSYQIPITITQPAPFQLQLSPTSLSLSPGGSAEVQATIVPVTGGPAFTISGVSAATVSQRQDLSFPSVAYVSNTQYNLTFHVDAASAPSADVPVIVTAQSTAGDKSSVALPVSISSPFSTVNPASNRSTVVTTGEDPNGVVYDQARKLLFLAISGLNQVRVLSSLDYHTVATIPVPQYQGYAHGMGNWGMIDESADGSAIYVGGAGEITTINPATLQVTGFTSVPQGKPIVPGAEPMIGSTQVVTLSTGKVLALNQSTGHLFLWDPATGSMTADDPQSMGGAISMIRSGNHNMVLVFGKLNSAYDALYDANSASFVTEQKFAGSSYSVQVYGSRPEVALSPAGSQIVAMGGSTGISIYDDSFSLLPIQPPQSEGLGGYPIYSLDGSTLYLIGEQGYLAEGIAYSTANYQPEGLFSLNGSYTVGIPMAIDETGMIYGTVETTDEGQALVATDASHPGAIQEEGASVAPSLTFPNVLTNEGGWLTQTGTTTIQGASFDPSQNYQVYVGAPPASSSTIAATGVNVASSNQLNFTIPQGKVAGPANVTLTRPDGWFSIIADGLSYGPTVLAVTPNTFAPSTTSSATVIGFGFGTAQIGVGGSAITNGTGEQYSGNPGNLLPLQQMTAQIPSGSSGSEDLTVASDGVTTTVKSGVHYLESQDTYKYPALGNIIAMVYDQPRQRLYLLDSTNDQIDIFDLTAKTFDASVPVGKGPKGMTLTADGTELAVLNATDGTVSVIDPAQEKVVATYPILSQAELTQFTLSSIAQLAPHLALVALAGHGLRLLNLDTGSLSCAGVAGCDSTGMNISLGFGPSFMTSTTDGMKAFITDGNSQLAVLNMTNNTLTAKPGVTVTEGGIVVNHDGTRVATDLAAYDGQLDFLDEMGGDIFYPDPSIAATSSTNESFNPSGSLLFVGAQYYIDVYDAHTSRVVIQIAEPANASYGLALAVDETGTKIFCADQNGLVISQLAEAPLSIATVSPSSGPGGTSVRIRGSGFENGTIVKFGSTQVSSSYVDSMTMTASVPALPSGPVQVTVINPDGTQYSFDDAFQVN